MKVNLYPGKIKEKRKMANRIPDPGSEKKVEIIVLPAEASSKQEFSLKEFLLTTYKCFGKKRDFTRSDAYEDRI
jgi:hypothetical protein